MALLGKEHDDDALRQRLSAREAGVRKDAAHEAGDRRVAAVAPRLVEMLRDGNAGVAATAAWALGRLRYTPAEAALVELLAAPVTALRKGAAWALGCLGTAGGLDRLLDALAEADETTVRSILVALDGFPDEIIMPALVARLHAPSGPARARASRALLRRPIAAIPALLAALEDVADDEAAVPFRRAAAHVLAAEAPLQTLPALCAFSHAGDSRMRLYATRGLSALAGQSDEARARLRELASDARRDVAAAAQAALAEDQVGAARESARIPLPLDLAPGLTYLLTVLPGLEEVAAAEADQIPGARVTRKLAGAILIMLDGPPAALTGLRSVLDALLFAGRLPREGTGSTRFRDRRPARAAIAAIAAAHPDVPLPLTVYIHVPRGITGTVAAALRDAARGDLEQAGAPAARTDATLTAEVVCAGDARLLGIRVLSQPPGRRPLPAGSLPASLHPTLAAAMIRLTAPADGDIFLDPLCGAGTLLRERALAGPYGRLIGGDADAHALALARTNLAGLSNLLVTQWDARRLPLDDVSIDKAALNPPYGRRTGSHQSNKELYPALVSELARVVRPGGSVALVTAEQRLTTALLRAQTAFARDRVVPVQAGGLAVAIYVLRRR